MPVLFKPPDVNRSSEDNLVVSWLEWIPDITGNGSGPVIGYALQALMPSSGDNWQDIHEYLQSDRQLSESYNRRQSYGSHLESALIVSPVPKMASPSQESSETPKRYSFLATSLRPNTAYKFRVRLVGMHMEKLEYSWPGPATVNWTVTACRCCGC